LPSRGNPELLARCVDSLLAKADNPNNIEILLKLDEDDLPNVECAYRMASFFRTPIGIVVTPQGNGYYDIHRFLNNLAVAARGDWLFVFNDDAVITTQGWDTVLADCAAPMCWHGCPGDVMMLSCDMVGKPNANDFFLLRRKTFQLLGHVCRSPGGDVWLSRLMGMIATHARIPIEVEHNRDPERVLRHQDPPVWAGPLLLSAQMLTLQLSDALRLLGHVQSYEAMAVWSRIPPEANNWGRWRSEAGAVAFHARVEGDAVAVFDWSGNVSTHCLANMGGEWTTQARGCK
jgi:hypothetical protein